jgi:hypothetical protein
MKPPIKSRPTAEPPLIRIGCLTAQGNLLDVCLFKDRHYRIEGFCSNLMKNKGLFT